MERIKIADMAKIVAWAWASMLRGLLPGSSEAEKGLGREMRNVVGLGIGLGLVGGYLTRGDWVSMVVFAGVVSLVVGTLFPVCAANTARRMTLRRFELIEALKVELTGAKVEALTQDGAGASVTFSWSEAQTLGMDMDGHTLGDTWTKLPNPIEVPLENVSAGELVDIEAMRRGKVEGTVAVYGVPRGDTLAVDQVSVEFDGWNQTYGLVVPSF